MTKSSDSTHSQDTKSALLRAGQLLFSQKGYAAVSTREVAELAGVNLGSIQYHFGSKGELFVATIRELMESSGHQVRDQMAQPDCGTCVRSSSRRLAQFIKAFLSYLLMPQAAHPCRMMIREIFSETSEDPHMFETLVSTMTNEYIAPLEQMVAGLIKILNPSAKLDEVHAAVRSVIAQCTFYATHRPFQERIMGVEFSDPCVRERLGREITQFSLAAMRVDDEVIKLVLSEVFSASAEQLAQETHQH